LAEPGSTKCFYQVLATLRVGQGKQMLQSPRRENVRYFQPVLFTRHI